MVGAIFCLSSCGKPPESSMKPGSKTPGPDDPSYKQGTFLAEPISEAPTPVGFNRVVNSMDKAGMFAPPNFEWASPNAYLGALNLVDPTIGGAQMAIPSETMNLFCARVDLIKPYFYPAKIIVQPAPNWSIEGSQKALAALDKTKDWVFKGLIKSPMGDIPNWERTADRVGFKGAKLTIQQKRYLFCWKGATFIAFTDCPTDQVPGLSLALEQSILTFRYLPQQLGGGSMILPPESKKNERFATQGEIFQEESNRQRTQDMFDEVNAINRMNRERQELQNGNIQNQQPPPTTDPGQTQTAPPNQEGTAGNEGSTSAPPSSTPPATGGG